MHSSVGLFPSRRGLGPLFSRSFFLASCARRLQSWLRVLGEQVVEQTVGLLLEFSTVGKELEQGEKHEIEERELNEKEVGQRLVVLADHMEQVALVVVRLNAATADHASADVHARVDLGGSVKFLLVGIVRVQPQVDCIVRADNGHMQNGAQQEREEGRLEQIHVATEQ